MPLQDTHLIALDFTRHVPALDHFSTTWTLPRQSLLWGILMWTTADGSATIICSLFDWNQSCTYLSQPMLITMHHLMWVHGQIHRIFTVHCSRCFAPSASLSPPIVSLRFYHSIPTIPAPTGGFIKDASPCCGGAVLYKNHMKYSRGTSKCNLNQSTAFLSDRHPTSFT